MNRPWCETQSTVGWTSSMLKSSEGTAYTRCCGRKNAARDHYRIHTIQDCVTRCTCRLSVFLLFKSFVHGCLTTLFIQIWVKRSNSSKNNNNNNIDLSQAGLNASGTAEESQPWEEAGSERCGFVRPPPQSDRGNYREQFSKGPFMNPNTHRINRTILCNQYNITSVHSLII